MCDPPDSFLLKWMWARKKNLLISWLILWETLWWLSLGCVNEHNRVHWGNGQTLSITQVELAWQGKGEGQKWSNQSCSFKSPVSRFTELTALFTFVLLCTFQCLTLGVNLCPSYTTSTWSGNCLDLIKSRTSPLPSCLSKRGPDC